MSDLRAQAIEEMSTAIQGHRTKRITTATRMLDNLLDFLEEQIEPDHYWNDGEDFEARLLDLASLREDT